MLDLNAVELEILKFWEEDNTFQKSIRHGKKPFVIYEGPPTANGKPGIHHVLTRTFKDLIARFQTMNGRFVERKAGWDEHGLPVEIEVQKELKLHTKKHIEDYGVKEFNEACAKSTQKYINDWEHLTKRMGYWLDFKNAYRTSSDPYIKKVWNILHQMMEKDLIYKSAKIVPWACDSGCVVSNAEVSQGYKKVKHTSAYVLFSLCDDMNDMLAWTTTPWTLPSNMALAVNPNLNYKVCLKDGRKIFSLKEVGEVVGEISGKKLVGQEYYHPFTHEHCTVLAADFVKAEGTGIVHIAPAFGQDDYELWDNRSEPVCHVNPDGKFNSFLEGNVLADNFNKANKQVLEILKEDILSTEEYEHEYPHNWRTGKPLIYLLRPSWYVNVNKFRPDMIKANEGVEWFPEHIKEGRFGAWLKGDVDWSISRERFWGTPLPFPNAPKHCHKPEADEEGRTPEVLDCWFDSGAMPFAAFDEYQQADVICEAIDQTRGWFYSLLAIGVAIKGESPYKRVLCLGHILDKDSNKMSKSKGNVVDPLEMFKKYGADAVRWYMASNPVGNSIVFKEEALRNQFFNRFWNCYTFYEMYERIEKPYLSSKGLVFTVLDKWILAKLQVLVNGTGIGYKEYKFDEVVEQTEKFVDDLSNVWIRACRNRFWNTEGKGTDKAAFYVLHEALVTLCKVIAPIVPFFSEHVWKRLENGSVHLQDYPLLRTIKYPEIDLMGKMITTQEVVSALHYQREQAGIKLRQVLKTAYVPKRCEPFLEYIKEEVNVREVLFGEVAIDTELTEDLLAEGLARDFVRTVQILRKEKKMDVTDRIILRVDYRSDKVAERLKTHKNDMMKKLLVVEWQEAAVNNTLKVGADRVGIDVEKVL